MAAPVGFAVLGEHAYSAIPALTEVLTNTNSTASGCAAHALARIGKPGLDPLIMALKNPNPEVRRNAAEFLLLQGTNALPAIPFLQAATNDPDSNVRKPAAATLDVLMRLNTTNRTR
jgi:HEAT repeat protein